MPFVVGLTGGIGSGKSAAADAFAARGAAVVDTDAIAHELTGPDGDAMPAIRDAFGPGVVTADGRLDRARMRDLAFRDGTARKRLEAILHPMIRQVSAARVASARAPYVVLVVPLLVEGRDYRERVNRVVVVDVPEAVQIERTMARSGLDREQVLRILAAQASREARLAAADDVIDNAGDRAALDSRVGQLHAGYLERASHQS
jgi:dephospho-CoA kinase